MRRPRAGAGYVRAIRKSPGSTTIWKKAVRVRIWPFAPHLHPAAINLKNVICVCQEIIDRGDRIGIPIDSISDLEGR